MKMKDILNKLLGLGINHVFYDEKGNVKVPIGMECNCVHHFYYDIEIIKFLLKQSSYSTEFVENTGRKIVGTEFVIKFTDDISSPFYKKRKINDVLMEEWGECTFYFLLCMRRIRTIRPVGVPLIPIPLWKVIALMNY